VIVCICRAVSDRAIRAARDAGADTVQAIGAATGAGTCCGCCRGEIERILAEPLVELPRVARAPPAGPARESVPLRIAAGKRDAP
jgi:assimilatory nitrate reductase catalytic subunit